MKVFLDNIPMGDVPGPQTKPGEFFPRLVGLRVSRDGNYWVGIEPVYIPLVRIHRQAGQILIEINTDRPLAYITLQARRPFFNFFKFQWDALDSE
jgi:hypothetical protein